MGFWSSSTKPLLLLPSTSATKCYSDLYACTLRTKHVPVTISMWNAWQNSSEKRKQLNLGCISGITEIHWVYLWNKRDTLGCISGITDTLGVSLEWQVSLTNSKSSFWSVLNWAVIPETHPSLDRISRRFPRLLGWVTQAGYHSCHPTNSVKTLNASKRVSWKTQRNYRMSYMGRGNATAAVVEAFLHIWLIWWCAFGRTIRRTWRTPRNSCRSTWSATSRRTCWQTSNRKCKISTG